MLGLLNNLLINLFQGVPFLFILGVTDEHDVQVAISRMTENIPVGPVFIDHPYRVEATVSAVDETQVHTEGAIVEASGTQLVASTASFTIVGVVDLDGPNEVEDRHRHLLGDDAAPDN